MKLKKADIMVIIIFSIISMENQLHLSKNFSLFIIIYTILKMTMLYGKDIQRIIH